jgi:hypothetical protein
MSRAGNDFGGPARERSGWLIPLAIFLVTAVLTGLVLLYYLSPSPSELIEEQQSLTDTAVPVALRVGSLQFGIPANYIPYPSVRKGGAVDQLKLMALLPGKPRFLMRIVAEVFTIGFFVLMGWTGYQVLGVLGTDNLVSLPWVRVSWVQSVVPISAVLIVIAELVTLPKVLANALHPPAVTGGASH